PVAPAEARVDRTLVLGVLLRDRPAEDLPEGDREALDRIQRLGAHARSSPAPPLAGRSPAPPAPDAARSRMRRPRRLAVLLVLSCAPRACLFCEQLPTRAERARVVPGRFTATPPARRSRARSASRRAAGSSSRSA